jgi:hypothetical protein
MTFTSAAHGAMRGEAIPEIERTVELPSGRVLKHPASHYI